MPLKNITQRRKALISYMKSEGLEDEDIKSFSSALRELGLCDLRNDEDLVKVTETGAFNSFFVLYRLGVVPKLLEIKKMIKEYNV